MLLRRITKHVKDQNWFAVGIDFVIVVIGVGVALAAGEWMSARALKSDLKSAEVNIHAELYSNYLNALERLAVKDCYGRQIREVADQLKDTEKPWMPLEPFPARGGMAGALGSVLRTPYRGAWQTRAWQAASDGNLLIHMDPERRNALSDAFSISETIGGYQDSIFTKQSELKALMIATELSATDRLRYYDILAEIDAASALIGAGSEALISIVENLDVSLNHEFEQQFLDDLASRNKAGFEVYGDCFVTMTLSDK